MVFPLCRILLAIYLAILAVLIGKYNLPLPNLLKLLITPAELEPSNSLNNDFGLFVFAAGTDPVIDIVAIHGLDGHCDKSWTAANGKLWLNDFLPDKIPNARIMSYIWLQWLHGQPNTVVGPNYI